MAIDTVHEVEARLAALEKRYGIRILYAVEAGSRSWGYPSPDSDYDVRLPPLSRTHAPGRRD